MLSLQRDTPDWDMGKQGAIYKLGLSLLVSESQSLVTTFAYRGVHYLLCSKSQSRQIARTLYLFTTTTLPVICYCYYKTSLAAIISL